LLRTEKGGNPDAVRKSQKERFADETVVDQVIELDELWRKSNYKAESLKMEFNRINKEIGDKKKTSKGQDKCEDLMEKSKEIKVQIDEQKKEAEELDDKRNKKIKFIGNIISD
jgi:seryl-tRNA synthetase